MDQTTEKIVIFIKSIGIGVYFETIDRETFMPGMMIRDGALIIDLKRLLYPGDLLHEAGHIAVTPPINRLGLNDDLNADQFGGGNEMAAIAWSYAACYHINLDPHTVFHANGYKGEGSNILDNFKEGRYFGVPLLQYYGMCSYDHKDVMLSGNYPKMINWLAISIN